MILEAHNEVATVNGLTLQTNCVLYSSHRRPCYPRNPYTRLALSRLVYDKIDTFGEYGWRL